MTDSTRRLNLEYAQSEPSQRVPWERTSGASLLNPVLQRTSCETEIPTTDKERAT